MELIKTLFVTLNKMKDGKQLVSPLLKTKVIDSMLHMIKTYPFCCISHQQSIQILNALKESFDKNDVQTLKKFILVELQGQAQFSFPSGRTTSGPNMGQITQIAFELRNLTQAALDDEDSDADLEDSQITWEMRAQKEEMGKWIKFCKSKIDRIEKVWNRKLEEGSTGEDDSQ